jgi:Rps23 Pro-64 3,4-dihydroxylase Tpa1-like proline 4-hydroxylase
MTSTTTGDSPPQPKLDGVPEFPCAPVGADVLSIRGRRLDPHRLIAKDITDAGLIAETRHRFLTTPPFEHVVIDGLFDDDLLRLISEEFDSQSAWYRHSTRLEKYRRSTSDCDLDLAARTYFALAGSRPFVEYLQAVTDIPTLIPDPLLVGGGLHETYAGGRFDIHRDFDLHRDSGLTNALVMITYLNEDWDESYGGALELWGDGGRVVSVPPTFGTTILMRTSDRAYHGHPSPLTPPPGRTRRSVACYYYVNPLAKAGQVFRRTTRFLGGNGPASWRWKAIAKDVTPPALWRAAARLHYARLLRR